MKKSTIFFFDCAWYAGRWTTIHSTRPYLTKSWRIMLVNTNNANNKIWKSSPHVRRIGVQNLRPLLVEPGYENARWAYSRLSWERLTAVSISRSFFE